MEQARGRRRCSLLLGVLRASPTGAAAPPPHGCWAAALIRFGFLAHHRALQENFELIRHDVVEPILLEASGRWKGAQPWAGCCGGCWRCLPLLLLCRLVCAAWGATKPIPAGWPWRARVITQSDRCLLLGAWRAAG